MNMASGAVACAIEALCKYTPKEAIKPVARN